MKELINDPDAFLRDGLDGMALAAALRGRLLEDLRPERGSEVLLLVNGFAGAARGWSSTA